MRIDLDTALAQLAATQANSFSRAQVLTLGFTNQRIRSRLAGGRWLHHAPGVYGLAGYAPPFAQRLWVAHLAAGPTSVISHEAAAAAHGLTGFPRRLVVVTTPHGNHQRPPDAVLHQSTDLTPAHTCRVAGFGELPVTSVARTIVDLAAVSRKSRLEVALDDAVVARLTTFSDVTHVFASIMRRGKRGMGLMATLLDARGPGYVPPQSELERAFFQMLEDHGIHGMRRQHPHPGRMETEGCVDGAFVPEKVIAESDGRRWHTRIRDLARDHRRDNEAARQGWQTLRLLHSDIVDEPHGTARLVLDTLEARRAQLRIRT
jgi:very-short-patch-repair endonuclease